jgi:hypothetical protein
MHKVAPVLALAVVALLYATREDRSYVPQEMPAIPETTKPLPKPARVGAITRTRGHSTRQAHREDLHHSQLPRVRAG